MKKLLLLMTAVCLVSCGGLFTKQEGDKELSDQAEGQSVVLEDCFKASIQNGKVEIEFSNVGSESWESMFGDYVPYKDNFELQTQNENPVQLQIEYVGEGEAPYLFVLTEEGYVEGVSLWALATCGKTYTAYISEDNGIEKIVAECPDDCSFVYGETAEGKRVELLEQTTEKENEFVAKVKDFITDMYDNAKYIDYDFLEANCTKNLLQSLEEDYDYDKEPGEVHYAVWEFRGDSDDGSAEEYGIDDITYSGDNVFDYYFYDSGEYGCHTLKIVEVGDGKFLMDVLVEVGGAG